MADPFEGLELGGQPYAAPPPPPVDPWGGERDEQGRPALTITNPRIEGEPEPPPPPPAPQAFQEPDFDPGEGLVEAVNAIKRSIAAAIRPTDQLGEAKDLAGSKARALSKANMTALPAIFGPKQPAQRRRLFTAGRPAGAVFEPSYLARAVIARGVEDGIVDPELEGAIPDPYTMIKGAPPGARGPMFPTLIADTAAAATFKVAGGAYSLGSSGLNKAGAFMGRWGAAERAGINAGLEAATDFARGAGTVHPIEAWQRERERVYEDFNAIYHNPNTGADMVLKLRDLFAALEQRDDPTLTRSEAERRANEKTKAIVIGALGVGGALIYLTAGTAAPLIAGLGVGTVGASVGLSAVQAGADIAHLAGAETPRLDAALDTVILGGAGSATAEIGVEPWNLYGPIVAAAIGTAAKSTMRSLRAGPRTRASDVAIPKAVRDAQKAWRDAAREAGATTGPVERGVVQSVSDADAVAMVRTEKGDEVLLHLDELRNGQTLDPLDVVEFQRFPGPSRAHGDLAGEATHIPVPPPAMSPLRERVAQDIVGFRQRGHGRKTTAAGVLAEVDSRFSYKKLLDDATATPDEITDALNASGFADEASFLAARSAGDPRAARVPAHVIQEMTDPFSRARQAQGLTTVIQKGQGIKTKLSNQVRLAEGAGDYRRLEAMAEDLLVRIKDRDEIILGMRRKELTAELEAQHLPMDRGPLEYWERFGTLRASGHPTAAIDALSRRLGAGQKESMPALFNRAIDYIMHRDMARAALDAEVARVPVPDLAGVTSVAQADAAFRAARRDLIARGYVRLTGGTNPQILDALRIESTARMQSQVTSAAVGPRSNLATGAPSGVRQAVPKPTFWKGVGGRITPKDVFVHEDVVPFFRNLTPRTDADMFGALAIAKDMMTRWNPYFHGRNLTEDTAKGVMFAKAPGYTGDLAHAEAALAAGRNRVDATVRASATEAAAHPPKPAKGPLLSRPWKLLGKLEGKLAGRYSAKKPFQVGSQTLSDEAFYRLAEENGVLSMFVDRGGNVSAAVDSVYGVGTRDKLRNLSSFGIAHVAATAEDVNRVAMFGNALRHGGSLSERAVARAAKYAREVYFDYTDMTPRMRSFGNAIPFLTWNWKTAGLYAEYTAKHPNFSMHVIEEGLRGRAPEDESRFTGNKLGFTMEVPITTTSPDGTEQRVRTLRYLVEVPTGFGTLFGLGQLGEAGQSLVGTPIIALLNAIGEQPDGSSGWDAIGGNVGGPIIETLTALPPSRRLLHWYEMAMGASSGWPGMDSAERFRLYTILAREATGLGIFVSEPDFDLLMNQRMLNKAINAGTNWFGKPYREAVFHEEDVQRRLRLQEEEAVRADDNPNRGFLSVPQSD